MDNITFWQVFAACFFALSVYHLISAIISRIINRK
jgi:hypothetical protein